MLDPIVSNDDAESQIAQEVMSYKVLRDAARVNDLGSNKMMPIDEKATAKLTYQL